MVAQPQLRFSKQPLREDAVSECYTVGSFVVTWGRHMGAVGVRELKRRASAIIRQVRESREIIDITHRGEVVARLVPVERPLGPAEETRFAAVWADMDRLAAEIAAHWPAGVTAEEAVREQRREL